MKGYLDDSEATSKAFQGGWYHSGDVAAWHPDGYIEIRDRSKDLIIFGGENLSSIEVEKTSTSTPPSSRSPSSRSRTTSGASGRRPLSRCDRGRPRPSRRPSSSARAASPVSRRPPR